MQLMIVLEYVVAMQLMISVVYVMGMLPTYLTVPAIQGYSMNAVYAMALDPYMNVDVQVFRRVDVTVMGKEKTVQGSAVAVILLMHVEIVETLLLLTFAMTVLVYLMVMLLKTALEYVGVVLW